MFGAWVISIGRWFVGVAVVLHMLSPQSERNNIQCKYRSIP